MRRPTGTLAVVFTTAAVISLSLTHPASAATGSAIGYWRFNEGPGAAVAEDSTGNGNNAAVGSNVRTGVVVGKRTVYNFPAKGVWGGPGADRLVLVPDQPALDPGTGAYRVAVTFRTRQSSGNIVQKGQSRTYGGFWKIETHNGLATCLFRGSNREDSGVGSGRRVDDGKWHRVVCTRYPDRVEMALDGKTTDIRRKSSGSVSNTKEVSIGGKAECGGSVGCDYFIGDIDSVRISTP